MDTSPNTSQLPPQFAAPQEPKSSSGALVSAIIIIALLAAGAWYVWNDMQTNGVPENTDQASETDPIAEALMQTNSSDTASAIEADLESTDVGNLDAELQVQ